MAWWREARFGQFIHFGAYSHLGGYYNNTQTHYAEWIMKQMNIPKDDYEREAARPFNPSDFDASEWVKVCKDAGQKYMVITSKHHDGFSLYDTDIYYFKPYSLNDFSSYGTDILAELSKECKNQGIKFGLYYSIMDWHHPYFTNWGANVSSEDKQKYIMEMKEQLREIVDKYDPEVIWFDGEWKNWWTKQDGRALYKYMRTLKSDLIINNRVGKRGNDDGDFGTPEQNIPANGLDFDWESCMTMNNNWGYNRADNAFKSVGTLISNLVNTASKGGNYLLNVGPDDKGVIPQPSIDRSIQIGQWLENYGDSIYNTSASCYSDAVPWGYCTTTSDKLYAHVISWPSDNKIVLNQLNNTINSVHFMNDSTPLNYVSDSASITISLPDNAPNPYDSVIVIETVGKPEEKVRNNLALNKTATASNVFQNDDNYSPAKAVDGDMGTRWATDDNINNAWLEVDFGEDTTFKEVYISEWYSGSLRVSGYSIEYYDGANWQEAYNGTTIGGGKRITFSPVTSSKIRLNIKSIDGNYGPTINEFKVYND
jgi:alpha-L-fucosidase